MNGRRMSGLNVRCRDRTGLCTGSRVNRTVRLNRRRVDGDSPRELNRRCRSCVVIQRALTAEEGIFALQMGAFGRVSFSVSCTEVCSDKIPVASWVVAPIDLLWCVYFEVSISTVL